MPAGLLDIKRRMKSVHNTKKITKAMGLVATAKLRKSKVVLENNNKYFDTLEDIKKDIFNIIEVGSECPFIMENGSNKKMVVLFASNSGLCGGFNANVTTYLNEKYGKEKENVTVFLIGQRGLSYLNKFGFEVYDKFTDYKDEFTLKDARTIAVRILNLYLNKDIGGLSMVYTSFKSSVSQVVEEVEILPFSQTSKEEESSERLVFDYTKETDVIQVFLYRYLEGKIINAMYNSMTSEENARMQAMDGATKNADDIIESLETQYNRIRQSAITQEISEIVGGAEAQK
ncbi:MAG: ATP synthase F1 subunit gamma [Sarcina sp.]